MNKRDILAIVFVLLISAFVVPMVSSTLNDKFMDNHDKALEDHMNKHQAIYDKCMATENRAACMDHYDYDEYFIYDEGAFNEYSKELYYKKNIDNAKPTGVAGWLLGIIAGVVLSSISAFIVYETADRYDNSNWRISRQVKKDRKEIAKQQAIVEKKDLIEYTDEKFKEARDELRIYELQTEMEFRSMLDRMYRMEQALYRIPMSEPSMSPYMAVKPPTVKTPYGWEQTTDASK